MATNANDTVGSSPDWNSAPAWKLPGWFEPVAVATILIGACYLTRRRSVSLFGKGKKKSTVYTKPLLPTSTESVESLDSDYSTSPDSQFDEEDPFDVQARTAAHDNLPKERSCCGLRVYTPNTERFQNNWHSIFLNKFPFLIEIFYWLVTYALYRVAHIASQNYFGKEIWDQAEANGLRVLEIEQVSWARIFFPIREIDVQRWFIGYPGEFPGHSTLLTLLNRAYALIHIPGTVLFIAWYYKSAYSFKSFATIRRTMTLTNWLAFSIFTVYPCMPPRLLPAQYGFVDTVRRDSAESVFMKGKFVNSLAAMPSMHFGYSFIVGVTLIHHSSVIPFFRPTLKSSQLSKFWKIFFATLGFCYPTLILITIVATANHYWLDAIAGATVAGISLLANRIFMVFVPLEDVFFWCIRAKKPLHNCGFGKN